MGGNYPVELPREPPAAAHYLVDNTHFAVILGITYTHNRFTAFFQDSL